MDSRIRKIEAAITGFAGALIISSFEERGEIIYGRISLTEQTVTLTFDVEIYPPYPFQFHESESIRFINKELIKYDHINSDGSVCVHTLHHPELSEKMILDLNGLRHWMIKYYINGETNGNYEHIIVNHQAVDDQNSVFLFTDVDYIFKKGMHGRFTYSLLREGSWKKEKYVSLLVQKFKINGTQPACRWSSIYQQADESEGLFYFHDTPPVENRRFTAKSFHQLESYFSQEFLRYLDVFAKQIRSKGYHAKHIPLLVGYPINKSEIHWQVILIPINEFPNYGEKIAGTNTWIGRLKEQPILWAQTRNSSYSYFFGRGAFHSRITEAKILIVGIGAVGSMVATTIVRGGARDVLMVDHDIKEPENICRSEYAFIPGLTAKATELSNRLAAISPFVEVKSNEGLMDLFKLVVNGNDTRWHTDIKKRLDEFDIIFDCSTDNDIAFLLGDLDLNGDIFSLSITNHAKELICGTKQNLYGWLRQAFHQLERETEDLYSPTGCWSPTFKASYNDISVLVQYALRHINCCYKKSTPARHFYLSCTEENQFEIKLIQF
ncbi:MAG: ThiF family adenylyltransferase [Agriterribacter sp.]